MRKRYTIAVSGVMPKREYNDMYSIEMAKFGVAVSEARKRFGLTKKTLAVELKIPYTHIVAIEAGRSTNYKLHKKKIVNYFDDQLVKKLNYYKEMAEKLEHDYHYIKKKFNDE